MGTRVNSHQYIFNILREWSIFHTDLLLRFQEPRDLAEIGERERPIQSLFYYSEPFRRGKTGRIGAWEEIETDVQVLLMTDPFNIPL